MRVVWLARLLWWATRPIARRKPTQIITDGSAERRAYLRRWKIVDSTRWHPGLYLHNMILDDEASLHDHPYWSLSIALTDGLVEEYCERPRYEKFFSYDDETGNYDKFVARLFARSQCTTRVIRRGQIVWRSSRFAHRLVVRREAWTLFLAGPRMAKGWGFYCPRGHVHHEEYSRRKREARAAGRDGPLAGCGEETVS